MNKNKPTPLGELFIKYERAKNPATKAVYREIIANRLTQMEMKK